MGGRHTIGITAGLFLLVIIGFAFVSGGDGPVILDCQAPRAQWSKSSPPVNLTHIFCGEVKASGKPTGYHALAKERTAGEALVARLLADPNSAGVYKARVCMGPEAPKAGEPKSETGACKFSSMFPDDWDQEKVLTAILHAYETSGKGQGKDGLPKGKWRGKSGQGFLIEGWLLPNAERINTAYPLYE
ncbi:EndoU domain-containing protein [Rhodovibrionaceae bacterium A322]